MFNYKNHYEMLISELTDILIKSIEELPESDKELPPENNNVINGDEINKGEPLRFD